MLLKEWLRTSPMFLPFVGPKLNPATTWACQSGPIPLQTACQIWYLSQYVIFQIYKHVAKPFNKLSSGVIIATQGGKRNWSIEYCFLTLFYTYFLVSVISTNWKVYITKAHAIGAEWNTWDCWKRLFESQLDG